MANNENLKPIRSKSEAREKGRKGGIKSGIKRRERKTMRETLIYLLSQQAVDFYGEEIKGVSNIDAIMLKTIDMSINGNLKAIEFIRDTIGEKPRDNQEFSQDQLPQIIDNI